MESFARPGRGARRNFVKSKCEACSVRVIHRDVEVRLAYRGRERVDQDGLGESGRSVGHWQTAGSWKLWTMSRYNIQTDHEFESLYLMKLT